MKVFYFFLQFVAPAVGIADYIVIRTSSTPLTLDDLGALMSLLTAILALHIYIVVRQ